MLSALAISSTVQAPIAALWSDLRHHHANIFD
jgi:hypothetical protein